MSNRLKRLLKGVTKKHKILEIGPSCNPIAPKAQGWNAWILDHASREDLREKYRRQGRSNELLNKIEEVDFVWSSGPISESIIKKKMHGEFDFCIASHVIEHIPNPIEFYQQASILLKNDGALIMAVPDKRYCFDFFRPPSTTGEMLETHFKEGSRHHRRKAFDHFAFHALNSGKSAWGQNSVLNLNLALPVQKAYDRFLNYSDDISAPYVDLHGWVYTPSSFCLIILELNVLGIIQFYVEEQFPPSGCEFIVRLRRGRLELGESEFQSKRLELMHATLTEQADPLKSKDNRS